MSYTLTPASKTVTEGNTSISFTVTRSITTAAETIYASTLFDTARSPGDYDGLVNLAVSFSAGQSSKTFTVSINEDSLVESTEHFRVMIGKNATDGSAQALDISDIFIEDNDGATTYSLTPSSTTKVEGSSTITFTVSRGGNLRAETIYASTLFDTARSPGDYVGLVNKAIVFAEGKQTETFTVQLNEDSEVESTEHFRVMIGKNTTDGSAQALDISDIYIEDNDTAGTNRAPVVTGSATVNLAVGQVVPATALYTTATDPDGTVVRIRFWDSTPETGYLALDGQRITGSYVEVAYSQRDRVTYVAGPSAGKNDIVVEAFDAQGLDSNDLAVRINVTAEGTQPSFSIDNAGVVVEGSEAIFTVKMSGSITEPFTIWYSTYFGSASASAGDYPATYVNKQITFEAGGSGTKTIRIPVLIENPNAAEPEESFSVGLQYGVDAQPFALAQAVIAPNGASTLTADSLANGTSTTAVLALGIASYSSIEQFDRSGSSTDADYFKIELDGGRRVLFSGSAGVDASDGLDLVFIRLRSSTGQILNTDPSAEGLAPSFFFDVPGSGKQTYYLAVSAGGAGYADKVGAYYVKASDAGASPPLTSPVPSGTDWTQPVDIRYFLGGAAINTNLSDSSNTFLIDLLGTPSIATGRTAPGVNIVFATIPGVIGTIQGMDKAIDSLKSIFAAVFQDHPSLIGHINAGFPGGMLSVRYKNPTVGSSSDISSHAWGIAIDLTVDTLALDRSRDQIVAKGIAVLIPYFNAFGWAAGAGWGYYEDDMHFEVAPTTLSRWFGATVAVQSDQEFSISGSDNATLLTIISSTEGDSVISIGAQGEAVLVTRDNNDPIVTASLFSEIAYSGNANRDYVTVGPLAGTHVAYATIFLDGNAGNDRLDATAADRRIVANGGDGDDYIAGGIGDDLLRGGAGSDVLVGGGGLDSATFELALDQYSILIYSSTAYLRNTATGEVDLLNEIEQLVFEDKTILLKALPEFAALDYIATHPDLIRAFGADGQAGFDHYLNHGLFEGRNPDGFDGLQYLAGYPDLFKAYGFDETAAARHYIQYGFREGRAADPFDGLQYVAGYSDLIPLLGTNEHAAAEHFLRYGSKEGRLADSFDGLQYVASYNDLIGTIGTNEHAAALHFITTGFAQGRARDAFSSLQYVAGYDDLILAIGTNDRAAAAQFIDFGYREGRARDAFDGIQYVAGSDDLIRAFGSNEDAAARHYITTGFAAGLLRDSFDGLRYVAGYDDLIRTIGANEHAAAEHFVVFGFKEGRARASFDPLQYIATYDDLIGKFGLNTAGATEHFIKTGFAQGRVRDGFSALQYVATYPDLIKSIGTNEKAATEHFINYGLKEGRVRDGFNGLDYVAGYDDLIRAYGMNEDAGANHYIRFGFREGRAIDGFDGMQYLAGNDDLIRAFGANEQLAVQHFLERGFKEGRARDPFDGLQYVASYADLIGTIGANEHRAAEHFVTVGSREGRSRDLFDAGQYLANYADLRAAFGADQHAATQHYIEYGYFEGRTDDPIFG